MKATGIVRRIDDLGRVVIPKEIRRTLRIREGDPLEIFTDREGEIILKKYSPIGELTEFAGEYVESLFETTRHIAVITDRDGVIAVSGSSKKDYTEKSRWNVGIFEQWYCLYYNSINLRRQLPEKKDDASSFKGDFKIKYPSFSENAF